MTKRALISVFDKTNVVEFAKGLVERGYEIISTGGTLALLNESGVTATGVDDITGFPEILGGRVKTLHPKVHGGLLAKRSDDTHMKELADNEITPIDLVAVNLYPFKETLAKTDSTHEDIIENIDIGGPTMLRASAKNYTDVVVVVDPEDYDHVLTELDSGDVDQETRQTLAAKVFRHTAQYDAMIAGYFAETTDNLFPENLSVTYEKVQDLRYGENPHQQAAFYRDPEDTSLSLATAKQLHGKELSYNNIQDANAALEIVAEFDEPAAVAVKHMNPCGIGVALTLDEAFTKAYHADPISIFGGIVALNREVTAITAEQLSEIFLEIVMAPSFTDQALEILTQKKNIRIIELDMTNDDEKYMKLTTVKGGVLAQTNDDGKINADMLEVATERQPTAAEIADLMFAWKAVKHVKSNAIVLAKDNQTIGVGAGQMNRIGAAEIAIEQAREKSKGSVMASDAFFPMPDTVEAAVKAGVTAIIQPGGSRRDQDSIDVCNAHGIAMVFTKIRHFKH